MGEAVKIGRMPAVGEIPSPRASRSGPRGSRWASFPNSVWERTQPKRASFPNSVWERTQAKLLFRAPLVLSGVRETGVSRKRGSQTEFGNQDQTEFGN